MQKSRNPEMPKSRDLEIPKSRNRQIHKVRNSKSRNHETSKSRNPEIAKFRNHEIQKPWNLQIQKFRNQEITNLEIQKSQNPEITKLWNPEISKIQKSRNSEISKSRNPEISKSRNPKIMKSLNTDFGTPWSPAVSRRGEVVGGGRWGVGVGSGGGWGLLGGGTRNGGQGSPEEHRTNAFTIYTKSRIIHSDKLQNHMNYSSATSFKDTTISTNIKKHILKFKNHPKYKSICDDIWRRTNTSKNDQVEPQGGTQRSARAPKMEPSGVHNGCPGDTKKNFRGRCSNKIYPKRFSPV